MARTALRRRSTRLKDYLLLLQEHAMPGEDDLRACLRQLRAGQAPAGRALIEGCLPHVLRWTEPFRGQGLPYSRLIEAGNLAVIQAVQLGALDPDQPLLEQLQEAVEAAALKSLPAKP